MPWADVLSFGGGVNSTALAIMAINAGWRGEIVFADTGCENPETYCYMDYFEREWLQPRGMGIVRLGPQQVHSKDKGMGANTLIEYCERRQTCPMPAARWCTAQWKVLPIARYRGTRGEMLGIAADESHRQPDAIRPLVEHGVTRKGCINIIESAGLNVPRKSGCFICPMQPGKQWHELWRVHPELFERAARLEAAVAASRGYDAGLDMSGKVTLRQRELSYTSQIPLPDFDMDDLLAYKPCVCGL